MHKSILLLFVLALVLPSSAQVCTVDTSQPNDTFAYMRAEVKTLEAIREAINLSAKIKSVPTSADANHAQLLAEYSAAMDNVDARYDCAARRLQQYKSSTDENIQDSVDSLLTAIQVTQQVNKMLRGMVAELNVPAQHADDTAAKLADIKATQQVIFKMMLGGVKKSTFVIVRGVGGEDDWKPTAFTITRAQLDTLLGDVRTLAEAKTDRANLVDLCAEILLETLNTPLPPAGEVAKDGSKAGADSGGAGRNR